MGELKGETEEKAAEQKATEEAVKELATEITKQTGVPVHTDEAESQKTLEEMEAKGSSLRFQIKTPEQRTAAENAYKWAQQHRPSEYEVYALVDMKRPQMLPVYFSKADIASKEKSYFNKLGWGNYKLINLDRTFEDNIKGLTGVFPEEFNPEGLREHRGSRWAGGEIRGMDKLPNDIRMNPDELYSEIFQYHGDYISKVFNGLPEDATGSFVSCHNGVWYRYSILKEDNSINILDAIPAKREQFDKFKKLIEGYGFDGESEAIYSNLQKNGSADRRDSDLLNTFLRGRITRDYRVHTEELEDKRGNVTYRLAEQTGRNDREGNETRASEIKAFRSKNGEVYGFVVDGEIHLDTAKMKADTPLHEYTHLWTEALRRLNPEEWENVKLLFDEVEGLKDEVQKLCSIKILFVPLHKLYTLYIYKVLENYDHSNKLGNTIREKSIV